jgi:hypothetical protein
MICPVHGYQVHDALAVSDVYALAEQHPLATSAHATWNDGIGEVVSFLPLPVRSSKIHLDQHLALCGLSSEICYKLD